MDFISDLGILALGSRLRRVSDRIMTEGAAVYRDAGIEFEPRWFPLFRLLADRGPVSVGEAASALGVTHAAISQTAQAMVQAGVAAAERDPADDRRRVLSLTDDGRARLEVLRMLWSDLEGAVREVADLAGADPLVMVESIEDALARDGLVSRTRRLRRERELATLEIVDYAPEHADAFRTLNEEWLRNYFSIEPVDEETFARCGDIVTAGGAILFARLDGELVGTCALINDGDARFELSKMAVTERMRGRHIGKQLMLAALDRAHRLGARSVFLMTNSRLKAAVSLYRRTGFKITHSGPHPKYARSDLVMELALTDQKRR